MRDRDGRERVILDLVDFQVLLDASHEAATKQPDLRVVIERLAAMLDEKPDEIVDLDEFLANYDAVHGCD